MALGDPIRLAVKTELGSLSVSDAEGVHAFRVPGARTSGDMKTVIAAVSASLKNRYISRKRIRHAALRLLRQGELS